jgi:hypothetical protein
LFLKILIDITKPQTRLQQLVGFEAIVMGFCAPLLFFDVFLNQRNNNCKHCFALRGALGFESPPE